VSQQELGRHYLIEIVERAHTVSQRCDLLLSLDFISEAPKSLTQAIQNTCSYLSRAAQAVYTQINWTAPADVLVEDHRLLNLVDALIKNLGSRLRELEGTRTERLPWSIVSSFEKLGNRVLPEVRVMLRATWDYSYTLHLEDQRAHFRVMLEEFKDYLPDVDIEGDVLKPLPRPFHIVSFPALERKHILLHTLVGHELGHMLVAKYLTDDKKNEFAARIKAAVDAYTDEQLAKIPADDAGALKQAARAQNTTQAINLWTRAVEELLSDLAGVFMFGPAALFAALEWAVQEGYDLPPDDDLYPPWRMRLRTILAELRDQKDWFPVPESVFSGDKDRVARVNRRITLIEELVAGDSDQVEIAQVPIAKIAYDGIHADIKAGIKHLLDTCNLSKDRPTAKDLYSALPDLISRLDAMIPPNAFESSLDDERIASFVEIVNAAWFHRVSLDALATDVSVEVLAAQRDRLNNLTLKAIEFSDLASSYKTWKAK
jgi:hypothetical protein